MAISFSIIKSRLFWTAAVLGVYNLATLYAGMFAGITWLPIVVNVLGVILATYLHVNPSQQYNLPSSTVSGV